MSVLAASYYVQSKRNNGASDIFDIENEASVNAVELDFVAGLLIGQEASAGPEWKSNAFKKWLETEVIKGNWASEYARALPTEGRARRILGNIATAIKAKHRNRILEAIQQVIA